MSDHVLLIHGTWCNGDAWEPIATELRERGFVVHAPSLRHHAPPGDGALWAAAEKIGKVGLLDYVADLEELVRGMDAPPIIVGHSVGALLAQLLAARVPNRGVVLLGPAPTAGMFGFYPSMFRLWGRYLPQWLGGKPMYPVSRGPWASLICNTTPPELRDEIHATLCAESGTMYRQMALWFIDPERAARVDFAAITSPVLVITGSEDRCTVPRIGRVTAARYGDRGTYVELEGSDHMMTTGPALPRTLAAVDAWLESTGLAATRREASATVA